MSNNKTCKNKIKVASLIFYSLQRLWELFDWCWDNTSDEGRVPLNLRSGDRRVDTTRAFATNYSEVSVTYIEFGVSLIYLSLSKLRKKMQQ